MGTQEKGTLFHDAFAPLDIFAAWAREGMGVVGSQASTNYLSIIAAARCARSTNQNGSSVPINSVPAPAIPSAAHVVQAIGDSSAVADSTATGVFALLTAEVFTATAVAVPLEMPGAPSFAEIRL